MGGYATATIAVAKFSRIRDSVGNPSCPMIVNLSRIALPHDRPKPRSTP
jgi:hypothetical protein